MPIYEYCCNQCGRRSTVFLRTIDERIEPTCDHCGSADLRRLISRVAVVRSEESRLESLTDPSKFGDLDESDPRSMGRFMRKMSREMGEDLGPEFNEVVDRLESGESPEEIEKSMPDLPGGTGGESSPPDLD